jgi:non-heme chloroperoxidase
VKKKSKEKSQESTFVELDTGVKLHYSRQGEPDGEVIVFLHGFIDSSYSFSRLLPHLPSRYRVYALTFRGHGDSDKPEEPNSYDSGNFVADVIAFIESLTIKKCILVGHSMGATIAQAVTLANPERITKLVLIGAAASGDNEVLKYLRDNVVKDFEDPIDPKIVAELQAGTASKLDPEFLDGVISESLKVPVRVWKEALQGLIDTDYSAQLNRIDIPTLIMWGENDEIFSRDDQNKLLALLPKATFQPYSENGHAPHWENPQRVATNLIEFLAN